MPKRGLHCASGCNAVVHDKHGFPAQVDGSMALPQAPNTLVNFLRFLGNESTELVVRNTSEAHCVSVDVDCTAFCNRTHSKFRLHWRSKLAHHANVERRCKRVSDFVGHDDAASRKPDDNDVVMAEALERSRELSPCIDAISKVRFGLPAHCDRGSKVSALDTRTTTFFFARAFVGLVLAACVADRCPTAPPPLQNTPTTLNSTPATPTAPPTSPRAPRARLDGRAFPDKVLALSWDDGPDASTFELATYLAKERISATFFVVNSWVEGVSDDPGSGKNVFQTGYESYPIVGDLVALGHRVGNHTLHHIVLREAVGEKEIDRELRQNQRALDPFITNELRLFRAPGGGWTPFAEHVVDRDSYLVALVGPVFWDVDRKDWDASLACVGARTECERGPGVLRTKPSVVAARYLETIERVGHGIVLLHDRVGDVGSTYALTIAHALIPELKARGYVFAAPVLHFSPLTLRLERVSNAAGAAFDTFDIYDVDGDGRGDVCELSPSGVDCAVSVFAPTTPDDRLPRTIFHRNRFRWEGSPTALGPRGPIHVADVTGDGKDDSCVVSAKAGVECTTSDGARFGRLSQWSATGDFSDVTNVVLRSVRFADINGDGRADVCAITSNGLDCALSTGRAFTKATPWLSRDELVAQGWQLPERAETIRDRKSVV
jgi:peptidoglycan/xylan/chitin deacetylase (PgdA/CDA1 family)